MGGVDERAVLNWVHRLGDDVGVGGRQLQRVLDDQQLRKMVTDLGQTLVIMLHDINVASWQSD